MPEVALDCCPDLQCLLGFSFYPPEYAYTLKVNEKSDIYSFGVVLMELLTGNRPIEPSFGDGVDIVQWVRQKIQTKDGVLEILDSTMGGVGVPLQVNANTNGSSIQVSFHKIMFIFDSQKT